MSLINNVGNTAKQMATGIGRMLTPPKKIKPTEPKNFIKESPEDYATRLMQRRNRRY